ncbi:MULTISPECIES: DUF1822 family protein [Calothrix]|uniref:DUF1822 family protein n=2 Tax=Calothrix TaxID=1186 RepID=A0ABR8AHZ5_9CYAN|nr:MULTISPECIES: DUF1822 family protein [Calothrix]MBD2199155.1 DUF1822 family protein [Calothrix parietina FACHB-288]MBD2227857.1 DUF1822 family protein [Calothrix anomala FACHB-343]
MNSNWNTFQLYPNEDIWLDCQATEIKQAEAATNLQTNQTARHYAYINHLCLHGFLRWLKENWELDSSYIVPSARELASIWELVNGTAITIGERRLVLIPHDAVDTAEFSVPQEWVDIPNFVASYYLPVQINLEQNWLRFWGYITHKTLKEKGVYDPIYRTYSVKSHDLIPDLDIILLAREICGSETANIPSLPLLPSTTAASLIDKLSQPSPYSPRLDIPFTQWGALLANDEWREQIYLNRTATTAKKMLVNLHHWLKNDFTESMKAGWCSVSEFFTTEPKLVTVRNTAHIKQAKLLNLQLQIKEQAVILLVALTPEADGRVGVLVQAHPYGSEKQLPAFLTLALLSDSSQQLYAVTSRERDSYIQLPHFHCEKGTNFYIKIAIADVSFVEEFAIDDDN